MTLTLHDYWRSSASYRVRIALNLKGLDHAHVAHDLRAGEQRDPGYLALNPQGLVPAIETGEAVIAQSPAIIEWLEERYPDPPLLPKGASERAVVRGMAALVACDIHPLNNLRVLDRLRSQFDADSAGVKQWIAHWIGAGFEALEKYVARYGGGFAYGDAPTMADCYLVPQIYSAERYKVELTPYPRLVAAAERARALPAFERAHPDKQADADR